MTVRAKFVCQSVTHYPDQVHVEMYAAHGNSPENKAFNDATPSGNLKIGIQKSKPAAAMFEPGKAYFLDFTLAE